MLFRLLAGVLVLTPAPSYGTSIVLVWARGQGIMIAADSMRIRQTMNPEGVEVSRTRETICKIRRARDVFFACAGRSGGPNFDVADIAHNALDSDEALHDRVEELSRSLSRGLKASADSCLSEECKKAAVQCAVAGWESSGPVAYSVYWPVENIEHNDYTLAVNKIPDDIPSRSPSATLRLGNHDAIDADLELRPLKTRRKPLVDILDDLLSLEAEKSPHQVGRPFDTLFISESGSQWLKRDRASRCPGCP